MGSALSLFQRLAILLRRKSEPAVVDQVLQPVRRYIQRNGVRNAAIDLYQFAQAAKTVKDFCATSPRATVMSAAEPALGIKMPRPR
jgi:hypothetical protein